jgi:hypothetical protein
MTAMFRTILLWLTFVFACFLPASALTPTASENCIWGIFSIGYDATTIELTDLGNRTGTSTSREKGDRYIYWLEEGP